MNELTKETKGKKYSQGLGFNFGFLEDLKNKDRDDFSLPKVDLVLLLLNETCFLVVLMQFKVTLNYVVAILCFLVGSCGKSMPMPPRV